MYFVAWYIFVRMLRLLTMHGSHLYETSRQRQCRGLLTISEFALIGMGWVALGFVTLAGNDLRSNDPAGFAMVGLLCGLSFFLTSLCEPSHRAVLAGAAIRPQHSSPDALLAGAILLVLLAVRLHDDAGSQAMAHTVFLFTLPLWLLVRLLIHRVFLTASAEAGPMRSYALPPGRGPGTNRGRRFLAFGGRHLGPAGTFASWKRWAGDVIAKALDADANLSLIAAGPGRTSRMDNLAPMFRDQPNPLPFVFEGNPRPKSTSHGDAFSGAVASPAAHDRVKRALDLMLAAGAILFLLPIFLLVAIAIKVTSPGPVIFRQARNGLHGRKFTIYKFRSMSVEENGNEVRQATRHDDRVTAVGRLIRKTSLDELPQLFNVIRGDMSLVGPRPHAIVHDEQYRKLIPSYPQRWAVRPGITGQAQVSGFRGETPEVSMMADRIEQDIWYVQNWSLMLDIKILLATLVSLFRHRDVY